MTATHRAANFVGVVVPAAGTVYAIVLLWDALVGPTTLVIAVVMYACTGLGISVGFHRLFAHRSFRTSTAVSVVLGILGSMAMMGPLITWVANHRKHHTFADEPGDPHSPHARSRGGAAGALAGLWHAHLGWILNGTRAARARYGRDLLGDRALKAVDRTFAVWVLAGLAIPFAFGAAIEGTLGGGLRALLWGGLVRIFVLHHMAFAVNSLCHFAGRRRFETRDQSRNLGVLAAMSFGEAWHNNHHAFPTAAVFGLGRREIDPGGLLIRGLERAGLVWDVRRVEPERAARRLHSTGV